VRLNIQRLKAAGLDVQVRDDVIEIFGTTEVPKAIITQVRATVMDPGMQDWAVDRIIQVLTQATVMSLAE